MNVKFVIYYCPMSTGRFPIMEVIVSQVETSKVYLRDTTVISPYDLLLFGGDISVQHQVSPISLLSSFPFWFRLCESALNPEGPRNVFFEKPPRVKF